MKLVHRDDLFSWSEFDETRNLDFNSWLWKRSDGNVLIDPLPMSVHDRQHLENLGGVSFIVVTNSDHCRDAEKIANTTGAKLYGPSQEKADFPLTCDQWLQDGDQVVPGLTAIELEGSKTPGELALLLDGSTLITGDLVRCHKAGELCLLPDAKLSNKSSAIESVRRLAALPGIEAVLTGDGWPIFRYGAEAIGRLVGNLSNDS
jgi:glyoxylase-like metal-dependent hydrolase (beta-lactamase superfamily II)